MTTIFRSRASDVRQHDGQEVVAIAAMPEDHYDRVEVGPMWYATLASGATIEAFDDELIEVAKPANHVTFYASQDVPEGRGEPLSTWSVYREEYAPNDLDNPLDGLTVMVATVVDEATADALVEYLYERNVR